MHKPDAPRDTEDLILISKLSQAFSYVFTEFLVPVLTFVFVGVGQVCLLAFAYTDHPVIPHSTYDYKLLWLPSVASQIAVCSAPLRGADRSTRKYCRLIGSSNCKRVQLRAARPFGALDNLTDNAIPCDRNRVNSLRICRRPSVRSISNHGSRSGRAESTRSHGSQSFD